MPERSTLSGKRLLITGAARGLGEDFALAAVDEGARVVIADILEERGQATANRIRSANGEAYFASLDLANADSIGRCVAEAVDRLGGLDGLVNNAAVTDSGGKLLDEVAIEMWDRVMTVNVRGTWLMTKAALPYLKESSAGRVINLASDTALWGAPRLLAYVASKGAVIAMTRSMARELGQYKITVNAVAPGLTLVEATQYVPAERHQLYSEGRAIARAQVPQDVCGAVMFLLSDAASFVSGQLLTVNGGFVMH